MYDFKTGSYTYTTEKFKKENLYQKESSYYLKYNSDKALYAIEKLLKEYKGNIQEKCLYYHIYLDLLFQSVGMIINRFKPHKKTGNIFEQAKNNCIEYEFNKENYPLLSNKSFRNFIEHIDERDEVLIDKGMFFGTFNVIYKGMDNEIREGLLNPKQQQNNLLNLEEMTYSILDIERTTGENIERKDINIIELKKELEKINDISKKIWWYLTERF